jgi:hypothetical protein
VTAGNPNVLREAEGLEDSKRPVNPPHLWALNFPQF